MGCGLGLGVVMTLYVEWVFVRCCGFNGLRRVLLPQRVL